MRLYTLPGGEQIYGGQFSLGEGDEVITFPSNWLDLASSDDLARFGISVETIPDPQPVTPDPGTVPPILIASALSIEVADSDIQSIAAAFNLVGGIYLDIGQYMLLFLASQPDANYFAVVTGSASRLEVNERATDYLIVSAFDGSGSPYDPSSINVQVYRMES